MTFGLRRERMISARTRIAMPLACERRVKLLIVGFAGPGHMGSYLASAARQLGLDYHLLDASAAEARSRIGRSFYWRFRGKRPARMDRFGRRVLDTCAADD